VRSSGGRTAKISVAMYYWGVLSGDDVSGAILLGEIVKYVYEICQLLCIACFCLESDAGGREVGGGCFAV